MRYYYTNSNRGKDEESTLIDSKAISKTILREIKRRVLGKAPYGNKQWSKADDNWYTEIHKQNSLLHQDFVRYFKEKRDVETVLEIGCGTGVYPIKNKDLFANKGYTGIDFSSANIEFCKKHSNFKFISGDFLKMNLPDKYDLVFSHAVIDHVYDIDEFLRRVVLVCKKYAYINSYRGYFPDLKKHKMHWRDDDNCYYNDISVKQTKQVLINCSLNEEEFLIRKQDNEAINGKKSEEMVIEITRKT